MGDVKLQDVNLIRRKIHVGVFTGKSVDINDPVSIEMLYNMGYYGKGHLSRSKPQYEVLQVNTRIFSLTTCAFAQRSQDEVLSLGLEEAFFLSYALEALVVKYQGNFLTLEEMCDKFTASASNFLSRYVVYHHFRCKGWVVKYGLKFATDYVLYWQSPETFHGSYLVLVLDHSNKLSWTDMCGFDRVAENASKELVLCSIELSKMEPGNLMNFLAATKLEINVLSRWVGAQNRDS